METTPYGQQPTMNMQATAMQGTAPTMPSTKPAAALAVEESKDRYGFTFLSVYTALMMVLSGVAAYLTTMVIIAAAQLVGEQAQIGVIRVFIFLVTLFVYMTLSWFAIKLFENIARIAQSLEKLNNAQ